MELIPEHLLVDIFKTLDKKSLKAASKVCLRWHEIITSSKVITKSHCLKFNMKNPQQLSTSIEDLECIPYKYMFIISNIHQNPELLNEAVQAISNHADHIEEIGFIKPSMNTVARIIDVLNCDKITGLSVSFFIEEQLDESLAINLPNLKSLDITDGSRVLRLIKSHKIEVLSMLSTSDYIANVQDINKFLQTCPDLVSLTFENFFPILETATMVFRLKLLSIKNSVIGDKTLSRAQMDSIKNMIEMSSDTLRIFNIDNYTGIDDIFQFMLPKVKNLGFLAFSNARSASNDESYPINRGIKTICGTYNQDFNHSNSIIKKLIESCPNVEGLNLSHELSHYEDVTSLIHAAALHLPNLKELSILDSSGLFSNKYPPLKNLETLNVIIISSQKDVKPLINLLMAAPKLKKLIINVWHGNRVPYLTKRNLKKILTSCKELEEIHIGGNFFLPKSFVDGLLESKSNVRSLVIKTSQPEVVLENARKLFNSKVRCTVLQWQLKGSNNESSDNDESHMDESSDNYFNSSDELNLDVDMIDLSGDQFMDVEDPNMDIDADLEEEQAGEPEDVGMVENSVDNQSN